MTDLRVGVLAVQGAVSEHVDALKRAAAALGRTVEVVPVRVPADLERVSGIIVPGGESTTISRLLRSTGLQGPLLQRAGDGSLAVLGTCAGLILCASRASHHVDDKDIQLLGLLDAEVDRNAFGRQRESCEATVAVEGMGSMPAVFIRAPALASVWGETRELARLGGRIVAAQRNNVLGVAFHPELTPDTRVHERFLELAGTAQASMVTTASAASEAGAAEGAPRS